MSLVYRKRANAPSLTRWVYDYCGELVPFVRRIDSWHLVVPLALLKSIEWGIYRWYRTPIRRLYGVKGNELIYMITRRCSDRCAKCGIWKTPESEHDHLPVEAFLECLNRMHENLYQLTLTGGEPLLYMDDVLRIGEASTKLGVPMFVVTNGTLLSEQFLKRYAKLGHTLVVSVDTMAPARWPAFRGRDHFDQVMGNIELARSVLREKLHVQSVLALETRDDVARVAEFCRGHGLSHSVQPYMDFGGSWHSAAPFREDGVPCAARKNICVYPNGDVVKCFDHRRIPEAVEPLGNIAREDIVAILCKRRATEVSRLMKHCSYPCKQMSCNLPVVTKDQQA